MTTHDVSSPQSMCLCWKTRIIFACHVHWATLMKWNTCISIRYTFFGSLILSSVVHSMNYAEWACRCPLGSWFLSNTLDDIDRAANWSLDQLNHSPFCQQYRAFVQHIASIVHSEFDVDFDLWSNTSNHHLRHISLVCNNGLQMKY